MLKPLFLYLWAQTVICLDVGDGLRAVPKRAGTEARPYGHTFGFA